MSHALGGARALQAALVRSLLYFPSREVGQTPADVGLSFCPLAFAAEDGTRLAGWWLPTKARRRGHILYCHGNAGNVADRLLEARVLTGVGFDVLLFDYRGYGASAGQPDEPGTYRDARGARTALLAEPGTDPTRLIYLGESLGGAVALHLAVESPPAGLILQSAFTGIRGIARHHYPFVPPAAVPDWYPSLRIVERLRAPLLVLHGDRDDIVPLSHGQALYGAAPVPKCLHVFAGRGHNDIVAGSPADYAAVITRWAAEFTPAS